METEIVDGADTTGQPPRASVLHAALLALAVFLILGPFSGKAFHLDDPTFIWPAQRIVERPFDFCGFSINWYGSAAPMHEIAMNPPLVSYYIAAAALLVGWGEVALHLAMLLPAAAMVVGTYLLAVRLCSRPVLAALASMLTPVFLVSSNTVMCDVTMVSFWVWAVVLWEYGWRTGRWPALLASGVLIGLSGLTKYFGFSLLPLLLTFSVVQQRSVGRWIAFFLAPIVMLSAFEWWAHRMYGHGMVFRSAQYSVESGADAESSFGLRGVVGLSFIGGCLASILFLWHRMWSWRACVVGALAVVLVCGGLSAVHWFDKWFVSDGSPRWGLIAQAGVFVVAGIGVLGLAAVDLWKERTAASLLLFLWVVGTMIFASFLNWSVTSRTILPMAPAVGILSMRAIDRRLGSANGVRDWRTMVALVPAAALGLAVVWADYAWANSAREAARRIVAEYGPAKGTLWFQGHWGFQYYMQQLGAQPLDQQYPHVYSSDSIVVPKNNSNRFKLLPDLLYWRGGVQVSANPWVATMQFRLGAGFYSNVFGPLPFAFGNVPDEQYDVYFVGVPPRDPFDPRNWNIPQPR